MCEPMWQCSPTSSSYGWASTRRTAPAAAPEASENPNFWSSWPVCDELVGVRLDAGGHADVDPLPHPGPPRRRRPAARARRRSRARRARPRPPTARSARRPTCCCRGTAAARWGSRRAAPRRARRRCRRRATGPPRPPSGRRRAQERLASVVDVGAREGLAPGAAAGQQVGLVQHVRGGAVLRRERAHVDPADRERRRRPAGGARPDHRVEVVVEPQAGHRAGHIRSGALTPSRPRPFSSTVRVARHSSSRGPVVGATSSSPLGSTWHSSQNRCADLATFSSR